MLAPEQTRALAYLERKGSQAAAATLRKVAEATFAALEERLAEIPQEVARQRPEPDRWSILEVVDHLVESHRPAVAQLADLLEQRDVTTAAIPAGLTSGSPAARSWDEHRAALAEVHRQLLEAMARGTDDLPLTAKAPVEMVVKVDRGGRRETVCWVERLDWKAYALALRVHTLEHHQQVDRIVTAIPTPAENPSSQETP